VCVHRRRACVNVNAYTCAYMYNPSLSRSLHIQTGCWGVEKSSRFAVCLQEHNTQARPHLHCPKRMGTFRIDECNVLRPRSSVLTVDRSLDRGVRPRGCCKKETERQGGREGGREGEEEGDGKGRREGEREGGREIECVDKKQGECAKQGTSSNGSVCHGDNHECLREGRLRGPRGRSREPAAPIVRGAAIACSCTRCKAA